MAKESVPGIALLLEMATWLQVDVDLGRVGLTKSDTLGPGSHRGLRTIKEHHS